VRKRDNDFETSEISGNIAINSIAYRDIPVTESTVATIIIDSDNLNGAALALDTNADGTLDIAIASSTARR